MSASPASSDASARQADDRILALARAARAAGLHLRGRPSADRDAVLRDLATRLQQPEHYAAALQANARDLDRAKDDLARGALAPAVAQRLKLDGDKLRALASGLEQLATMEDLVHTRRTHRELDDGLILEQLVEPLGVIGVVFEARPDAVIQIASLALRSGNAVLLKGGSEALESNRALVSMIHEVLDANSVPRGTVTLLEERSDFLSLLTCAREVDLIVARGSSAFVHLVRERATIPVMAHAEGLCHLVLDRGADPSMAAAIAVDAKTSYPAACNSIETLLWIDGAQESLLAALHALSEAGVELRGCEVSRRLMPSMLAATPADWSTEYGALILSVRHVATLADALEHIAEFGSRHTEAIVTQDPDNAAMFLDAVDAACIFHNASTRFADGHRFGLGAEVGISTDKLHARGPVGVEGLMTTRWILHGSGQVSATYSKSVERGGRRYTHRDLP